MADQRVTAIDRGRKATPLRFVDEAELIGRSVVAEDAHAYGELVRRYQPQIRGFLRHLCRDRTLADDLAQESFLHAWGRLRTFRGEGSLAAWLMQIAYRTFLQWRRANQRYGEVLIDYGHSANVGAKNPAGDAGEWTDLERLLAVLSGDEQIVMILSYSYGMSHREISTTTGLPAGTVKSHIFRSKIKIRDAFALQEVSNG